MLKPSKLPVKVGEEVPLTISKIGAICVGVNELIMLCHARAVSAGWWHDLKTGQEKERNAGEMCMLMVSEISEGFEGIRRNLMDDKLPHRPMIEVELADLIIRACDFAGRYDLDISGAILEKIEFNASRPDHKIENRQKAAGKKF